MKISRIWEMPAKYTFEIPTIAATLRFNRVGKGWIDPFSGRSRLAQYRNDLDPANDQPFCMEAAEFIRQFDDESMDGAIFDPPYSIAQAAISYKGFGKSIAGTENPTGGFPVVRDELARVLKPGALCISFGWNSNGLGLGRGFQIAEIILLAHGGSHNDTIMTIERKNNRQHRFTFDELVEDVIEAEPR